METRRNVLVINIHGGFPSCMINKAFNQLPTLNDIYKRSEVHNHAYPSNSSAGPSLHDIIMDAPLGSMVDSVWHDWSHVRQASRTIFHVFKQYGYTTNIFGAFGLDKKLDPHANMQNYPGESTRSLEYYGVDEFETQDAAFTCQMAFAHDKDVISRACNFFENREKSEPFFTMMNLLGCQDIHKCNFESSDSSNIAVPSVSIDNLDKWSENGILPNVKYIDADEKRHAENVCCDNPRNDMSESSKIVALRRANMLYDWLRGGAKHNKSFSDTLRIANEMHRFAWKCLVELDKSLSTLFKKLQTKDYLSNTIIYITSDHPISLFEHGEICEAPWDSCLRSFLLIYKPGQTKCSIHPEPYTLAHLPLRIMSDCNIYADWHVNVETNTSVTIGICPSWLCRTFIEPKISVIEFSGFFVRFITNYNYRLYTIVYWFSIYDLLKCNNISFESLSYVDTLTLCTRYNEWKNPTYFNDFVVDKVQVYDMTTDPEEKHNIVNKDWIASNAGLYLKKIFNEALEKCSYQKLSIKFPENISELTPDKITFCSVQLHHRLRERLNDNKVKNIKDCECQTDVFNLSEAIERKIGSEYCKQLISRVQKIQYIPMTIFASLSTTKWQDWFPEPLIGCFPYDTFVYLARANISVTDIKNQTYNIHTSKTGDIILNNCVINKEPIHIYHKNGQVMLYFIHGYKELNETTIYVKAKEAKESPEKISERPVQFKYLKEETVPKLEIREHTKLENVNLDKSEIYTPLSEKPKSSSRATSPTKSEVSTSSDKGRKVKSRSELHGVRRVDSFNSRPKIQPNVTKGHVKSMEIGRLQKENHR